MRPKKFLLVRGNITQCFPSVALVHAPNARSNYLDTELRQTIDVAFNHVAFDHGTDILGRA